MVRTCKTCISCIAPSYLNGEHRCQKSFDGENPPTTPETPACRDWVLSEGQIYLAFERSLQKARREHPTFCPVLTGDSAEATYRHAAEEQRIWQREDTITLRAVILEEVYEFLAEIAAGNLEAAISEAGDLLAVMYRALNLDHLRNHRKEHDHAEP